MKASDVEAALATWPRLNASLVGASEADCSRLLEAEKTGRRRLAFLLRIYGKFNRLRAVRERAELLGETGTTDAKEVMRRDHKKGNWAS